MSADLERAYNHAAAVLRSETLSFLSELPFDSSDLDSPRVSYLYILLRPIADEPVRYIGKGSGHRMHSHAKLGIRHYNPTLADDYAEFGSLQVRKIIDSLTEREAHYVEAKLISIVGRQDLGRGPLANLTDGGEGVSGHVWTDEQRAAHSERIKAIVTKPEMRAAQSAKMKAYFADADNVAKHSERQKVRFKNPAERARTSARFKAYFSISENRASMVERAKECMNRPEVRAKLSSKAKAYHGNPEVRAANSARGKARYSDSVKKAEQLLIAAGARATRYRSCQALSAFENEIDAYIEFCGRIGIDGFSRIQKARSKLRELRLTVVGDAA